MVATFAISQAGEEEDAGKKEYERNARYGGERESDRKAAQGTNATHGHAPLGPRVALDSHESCVCSGGPAASCGQKRLALGVWLQPSSQPVGVAVAHSTGHAMMLEEAKQ